MVLRYAELAQLVHPASISAVVLDDPDDDHVLACALAEVTRADFLVTGDKSGLLSLKKHGRTAIVSARKFLEVIRK